MTIISDRLENVVANLAVGSAKSRHDRFVLRELYRPELTAMYRGDWMSRKIVDLPVADALRPWRTWQAETDDVSAFEAAERALHVRTTVARAFRWARLYGGAALLIANGDPSPDQPLAKTRRGGLRCVVALQRHEIQPDGLVADPLSAAFRQPQYYRVLTGGGTLRVHHSRVIAITGPERPDVDTNPEGWGDSVLQIVHDAVHHAALSNAAVAELIHDAKVDVIHVDGLSNMLSSQAGVDMITKRFGLANSLKSINNMLLLGEGETWERKQTSFAALPDVLRTYLQIVAGAADIPATRLLGQSPGGLNATGDSDLRNYHDSLAGWREDHVRPVLDRIDDVLWQHVRGTPPADAYYTFASLQQTTDRDAAEIAAKKAVTTNTYAHLGIFSEQELRDLVTGQLIEDGTYPGLEQILDTSDADTDPDEPIQSGGDAPADDAQSPTDHAALDSAIRRLRARDSGGPQ